MEPEQVNDNLSVTHSVSDDENISLDLTFTNDFDGMDFQNVARSDMAKLSELIEESKFKLMRMAHYRERFHNAPTKEEVTHAMDLEQTRALGVISRLQEFQDTRELDHPSQFENWTYNRICRSKTHIKRLVSQIGILSLSVDSKRDLFYILAGYPDLVYLITHDIPERAMDEVYDDLCLIRSMVLRDGLLVAQSADFTSILDNIKEVTMQNVASIKAFFLKVVEPIFGFILKGKSSITTMIHNVMDSIAHCISRFGKTIIKELLGEELRKLWSIKIIKILVVLFGLNLIAHFLKLTSHIVKSILGIISGTFEEIYDFLSNYTEQNGDMGMTAQNGNPVDQSIVLAALVSSVFMLTKSQAISMFIKIKGLAQLVSGGVMLLGVGRVFLGLLPYSLREALCLISESERAKKRVDDFLNISKTLLSMRKVSKVVTSEIYKNEIRRLVTEGSTLTIDPQYREWKSQIFAIFSQLLNVETTIVQMEQTSSTRHTPFCVHFFGKGGVGKTTMIKDLLRKTFHQTSSSIYQKAVNDSFWSGANESHKAIILDEFCINAEVPHGASFMTLVGTGQFQPEMPSLDSPTTGIKGTSLEPDYVFTIANEAYPIDKSVKFHEPMDRRRNRVVQVLASEKGDMECVKTEGTLDLAKFEEKFGTTALKNKEYLSLRFYPKFRNQEFKDSQSPLMSYLEFSEIIKKEADAFLKWGKEETLNTLAGEKRARSVEELLELAIAHNQPHVPTIWKFNGIWDIFKIFKEDPSNNVEDDPDDFKMDEEGTLFNTGVTVNYGTKQYKPENDCLPVYPKDFKIGDYLEQQMKSYDDKFEGIDDVHTKRYEVYLRDCFMTGMLLPRVPAPLQPILHLCIACKTPFKTKKRFRLFPRCHMCFLTGDQMCQTGLVPEQTFPDITGDEQTTAERAIHKAREFGGPTLDVHDGFGQGTPKIIQMGFTWIPVICYAITKIFGLFIDGKDVEVDGMEAESFTPKARKDTSFTRPKFVKGSMKAQSGGSWIKNVCSLERGTKTAWGIFVNSNILLTHGHFWLDGEKIAQSSATVNFIKNELPLSFEFDPDRLVIDTDLDIAFYDVGYSIKKLQQSSDITSKFVTRYELTNLGDTNVYLHRGFKGDSTFSPSKKVPLRYSDKCPDGGSVQYNLDGMKYSMKTHPGDCGSVVTSAGPLSTGKILGIHVAGSSVHNAGGCTNITKEDVEEAILALQPKDVQFDDNEIMVSQGLGVEDWETDEHIDQVNSHRRHIRSIYNGSIKVWRDIGLTTKRVRDHDLSKFSPIEKLGYTHRWVKMRETPEWEEALKHHYAENDHHKEFWGDNDMSTEALSEHLIDSLACIWERKFKSQSMTIKDLLLNYKISEKNSDQEKKELHGMMDHLSLNDYTLVYEDVELKAILGEDFPNKIVASEVDSKESIHISRKTKIEDSDIADVLSFRCEKNLPILSVNDSRSNGIDPVYHNIKGILEIEKPEIDQNLLSACSDELYEYLADNLYQPVNRDLSTMEAINGIPGLLKSMNMSTSAGYPCVLSPNSTKPGKKSWFDECVINNQERYTPTTETLQRLEQFESEWDGGKLNGVYLGYLKDEPVSDNKIKEVRTRIIWCGDMISTIAFRKKYGGLLISLLKSGLTTPLTMGLNQYSRDVHSMWTYLNEITGPGYLAGDFKDFDKRTNAQVQAETYKLFMRLHQKINPGSTTTFQDEQFIKHQIEAWYQIEKIKFKPKAMHASGCFFTTPTNSFNVILMFMYIFAKKNPHLKFFDHVRIITHGDDHVLKITDDAHKQGFTPEYVAESMKELGQLYTSDIKGEPLTKEMRTFDQITFLGAYPRKIRGTWIGAIKPSIAENALFWKKSDYSDITTIGETMLDMMSIWDKEKWEKYREEVNRAFDLKYMDRPKSVGYERTQIAQMNRDSGTDINWTWFAQDDIWEAQSGTTLDKEQGVSSHGLSHFLIDEHVPNTGDLIKPASKGLRMDPVNMQYGLASKTFVGSFQWSTSDVLGATLYSVWVPFDLISNDPAAAQIQDLVFQQILYWQGDVELSFKVNGTPFQQGLLLGYFRPQFTGTTREHKSLTADWSMPYKVTLSPTESNFITLRIPYRHPRDMLNTYNRDENLGHFTFTVASPLKAVVGTINNVTVSIFVSFPNSTPKMMRPLTENPGDVISKRQPPFFGNSETTKRMGKEFFSNVNDKYGIRKAKFQKGTNVISLSKIDEKEEEFKAQGGTSSKVTYNISNVSGSVPIENDGSVEGGFDISPDLQMEGAPPMPLDNPPIVGGGVPVAGKYPSQAKTFGVEVTNNMSLHPEYMARKRPETFGSMASETNIQWLCGLDQYKLITEIDDSKGVGTEIATFDLSLPMRYGKSPLDPMTMMDYLGSRFMLWRADFELEVRAVKTPYHSFALTVAAGYGSPDAPTYQGSNNFLNTMMDFTKDKSVNTMLIPFNAQTEFLRTHDGIGQLNPIQDHSLGFLRVYVRNTLAFPENVPTSVDLIFIFRLKNASFAGVRPDGCVHIEQVPGNLITLHAQNGETGNDATIEEGQEAKLEKTDQITPQPVTENKALTEIDKNTKPCSIHVGERVEYCVRDMLELFRRPKLVQPSSTANFALNLGITAVIERQYNTLPDSDDLSGVYAGWRGSMKYRVYATDSGRTIVNFTPMPIDNIAFHQSATLHGVNGFDDNVRLWTIQGSRIATEFTYETSENKSWIDVAAPFIQHKRFNSTKEISGAVGVAQLGNAGSLLTFRSFGDDFSYGCFSGATFLFAPLAITIVPPETTSVNVGSAGQIATGTYSIPYVDTLTSTQ